MIYGNDRSLIRSVLFHFCITGISLLIGCSDNPIDDDDHAEIHGLIVRNDSAVELLRIEEDSVLHNTLTLSVDSTAAFALLFLGHHGETIIPEEGIEPIIESSDTTRVHAVLTTGQSWTITLEGRTAGSAELSIVLRHGGHDDFRSPPFTVVVE